MTVQFEFAKSSSGKIVYANNAEKGGTFICLNSNCNGEMILKKGKVRRAHFAHKHIEYNHAGETALHYNTKFLLYDFIQESLLNKTSIFLQFQCPCSETHSINLLDNVNTVYMEKQASDSYRPDISLYCDNELKMVIEVIVTHDLDSDSVSYLEKHEIPFLKIHISSDLYAQLLEKYISSNHALLNLSKEVNIKGIPALDYCKNKIPVIYYPELKNIFPCFGYLNINESREAFEYEKVNTNMFEDDFRTKLDDNSLPCDTCEYYLTKINLTTILCKNPLAKLNIFAEWDKYLTPTIFKLDQYYKSGKRHRLDGNWKEILEQLKKCGKFMDHFEYQLIPQCLYGEYGRYMKIYNNGKWVKPNDLEITMKQVIFYCGKHKGQNLEYVYKYDKDYLYWILLKKPSGTYFDEILEALLQMRNKGLI